MAGKEVTENRDKYIGGSDIPIIMGLSPFKTRYQLLLEKAHLKDVEEVNNPAIDYGNEMEPVIRAYLNKEWADDYGEILMENKDIADAVYNDLDDYREFFDYLTDPEDKICWKPYTWASDKPLNIADNRLATRVNADGFNGDSVIEIKTTSQIHDSLDGYKHYLVQLMFEMYILGARYGLLAVYHRPEDYSTDFDESRLQVFRIDFDEYEYQIGDTVIAADQFREDFTKIKENPFLTEEDLLPAEVVETSHKVIALEEKLAEFKAIEKQYKDLTDQLYSLMKENGIKKWETPNKVKITLIEPLADKKVMEFDKDAFKESHPELYNEYLKETIKKGRKGYIKVTL